MKRIAFLLISLSFCLQTYFVNSQNFNSEIDNLYQANNNEPGFSIAVFKGNEIILEKQYGSSNLDYNIPIISKTVFDIASISKQFTAMAILLLEKEGKLDLKEPAYKYIAELPRYEKGNPTIEQLLNQTSGIKEVDHYLGVIDLWFNDYLNQSQMMNIITKVKELRFIPGEHFYYTNANYILLASIIEKASGETYSDYLQKEIFDPLKMINTTVKDDIYKIIPNRAIGYLEDEGQFYKTHFHSVKFAGDGQILTNPSDMHKWHLNLTNPIIGSKEILIKMHTKATLNNGKRIDYGLGVEFETHHGYEATGFDGMSVGGFVSKYLYFPVLDIGFFTTQNKFEDEFRDRFFQLVDLYIPNENQKENTDKNYNFIKLSDSELKKYQGQYLFYYNDDDRKANSIKLKDNKLLIFTLDGDKIGELEPLGNDEFIFLMGDSKALIKFSFENGNKYYTYDDFDDEPLWIFNEFQSYEHSESELKEFEGQYYSKDFQISKKIRLDNGVLYYHYKNGALKSELTSLSKNILEISISPIEFIRNDKNEVISFILMGIEFVKI